MLTGVFAQLGLSVVERGWLSSNSIVFRGTPGTPATVVDTGYGAHAAQTATLLQQALAGEPLRRIVNTHLHSDHCGGNASLAQSTGAEVWVPEPSFENVRHWDEHALTFDDTGQRCERFDAAGALRVGDSLRLGMHDWRVIAAKGHDPDAVMLFQRDSGVLITADALWEDRLAIVFPEIDGEHGFTGARATLDLIEKLAPRTVIPGHGRAFTQVAAALQSSRARLALFERQPDKHYRYATRALTMFHMLEWRQRDRAELLGWLQATPIFARLHARWTADRQGIVEFAIDVVDQLLADGLLNESESGLISVR